jgi:RimJ/RimL family protein N-acetyltransferase
VLRPFSLRLASREHRQGEMGFLIHPDHHGHGYATEGSLVILRLGLEELTAVGPSGPRPYCFAV